MAELKYCKMCKKMFTYYGGAVLCNECKEKDELDFKKVRDYLRDNKGASLQEVSEATEVSINRINRYLKEGKIEVSDDSPLKLKCERCGEPIPSGRFCNKCAASLGQEMRKAGQELAKEKEDHGQSTNDTIGFKYHRKEDMGK